MSESHLKLLDPNGKDPRGNSALGSGFEDKRAQGHVMAEYNKRLKELERNIEELKKLPVNKEKSAQQQKRAPAKSAAPGKTRHVAHAKGWKAVSTEPDLCHVGDAIIAFDSFATLDNKQQASPNVKACGTPVYRQGDIVKNVQANAGKHVVSGTSRGRGYVQIRDGHDNVKVNGVPVARHDSKCTINCDASGKGGAKGKLITEQKSVGGGNGSGASNPAAPPNERTNDKLEKLKAARAKIASEQLDFDALDEYVDFKRTNELLKDLIGEIKGTPGTTGDYVAQVTRGALGFGADAGMGLSQLAYEGLKGIPKLIRSNHTDNGKLLTQLDSQIFAEDIRLGNITAGGFGKGVLNLGKAIVKPVMDPWSKGQYLEAGTRAVSELGTIWYGWTKARKTAEAAKAANGAAAETADTAAEVAATAQAAKEAAAAAKASYISDAGVAAGHVDDGVHIGGHGMVGEGARGTTGLPNLMPEMLEQELAVARSLGVSPTKVTDAGFERIAEQGPLKWAVLENGDLVVVPKFAGVEEIKHSVLSAGRPVLAAGEATVDVFGNAQSGFLKYGNEINRYSGHFEPPKKSLQIGVEAFKNADIHFKTVDPKLPDEFYWGF